MALKMAAMPLPMACEDEQVSCAAETDRDDPADWTDQLHRGDEDERVEHTTPMVTGCEERGECGRASVCSGRASAVAPGGLRRFPADRRDVRSAGLKRTRAVNDGADESAV